jgi:GAF domain-containing protein
MNVLARSISFESQRVLDKLRLRFVRSILIFAWVLLIVQIVSKAFLGQPPFVFDYVYLMITSVALLALSRTRYVELVTNITMLSLLIAIVVFPSANLIFGVGTVALIGSAVFGHPTVYYTILAVVVSRAVVFELERLSNTYNLLSSLMPYLILVAGMSILLTALRKTVQELENDSRRTADLLAANATIGQVISQYLEITPLLTRSVEIVRERLVYYHVQIFLTDDQNTHAKLAASAGDIGTRLLQQSRQFPLDSKTLIGRAIQAGEAVKWDARGEEKQTFAQELPNTHSELVVPIIEGDRIIGALDVHSTQDDAFSQNDVQTLRVVANQLATAIRNARLFEQQEQTIRENKRLFLESETNLREIERLNRQLTKQAWDDYLKGRGVVAGVTWSHKNFKPGAEWSDQMLQAAQRRRVMSQNDPLTNKRIISVPVELRGEVMGAIEIETDDGVLVSDTVDMLQAISQRLAISLDNARLFEETQEATAQEQRISEIVSGYQSAESIEDLLQITLQGLTEALGAEQGAIRLGNVPSQNGQNGMSSNGMNGGNHA